MVSANPNGSKIAKIFGKKNSNESLTGKFKHFDAVTSPTSVPMGPEYPKTTRQSLTKTIQTSIKYRSAGDTKKTVTMVNQKHIKEISSTLNCVQYEQVYASAAEVKFVGETPTIQWPCSEIIEPATPNSYPTNMSKAICNASQRQYTKYPTRKICPDGHVTPSESVHASVYSTKKKAKPLSNSSFAGDPNPGEIISETHPHSQINISKPPMPIGTQCSNSKTNK